MFRIKKVRIEVRNKILKMGLLWRSDDEVRGVVDRLIEWLLEAIVKGF